MTECLRRLGMWAVAGCALAGCGTSQDATPTAGVSAAPLCSDLNVQISWHPAFPTVPRFTYDRQQGAGDAVLTVVDPPFVQTFIQHGDDPDVGRFASPLTPGLEGAWNLSLRVGDNECTASGTLINRAYEPEQMPPMRSTWAAGDQPRRDLHIWPAQIAEPGGGHRQVILMVDELGRLLWTWQVDYPLRNVRLDKDGRGVWTLEQLDVPPTEEAPPVELELWSWTGEVIEHYSVPSSHHDFDLSPDQRHLDALAYVHDEALEALCGGTVFADVLNETELATGVTQVRWSSAQTRVHTPTSCAFVPSGVSFDYANGFERVGDTLGISLAGGALAFAIGAADGAWYLVDSHNDGDLTVVIDGDDLPDSIARAPHSLLCTEGAGWGIVAPDDAITCLGFNRGLNVQCDTADLFWVDRGALTAHYVSAWPLKSQQEEAFPGCGTTFSHGDASLIGQPGSMAPGYTRLAMFSSNEGKLQVIGVHASAEGTSMALEYVISPEVPGSITGEFATSAPTLGSAHRIGLSP